MHIGGEPFSDLVNAKFSLGDGFSDEFVGLYGLQLEIVTIDPEKGIGSGEADSLVAIEESVIARERLHQGCGFVDQVVVIAILGTEDSCFKKTLIAKPVDAAEFVDELTVHLDSFAHGQINIARRSIAHGGHGDYLARS
jgi:hypothetical protein